MNCDNNNHQSTQSIADYLAQLLKDRKQLTAFPNLFNHVERLLDEGMCANYIFRMCQVLREASVEGTSKSRILSKLNDFLPSAACQAAIAKKIK